MKFSSKVRFDHLTYIVPDLDDGITDFEQRLGVRPIRGGSHSSSGTHNALLSLGPGAYLELLAPDRDQAAPPGGRRYGLDDLREPRLATWCIQTNDFDGQIERSRASGYDPGALYNMSRLAPDGSLLTWRMATHAASGLEIAAGGLVPFLIDWGDSPHPSTSAPRGVELVSLIGVTPEPKHVANLLVAVGVEIELRRGDSTALIATLDTPLGVVELA